MSMRLSPRTRNRLKTGAVAVGTFAAVWWWLGREPDSAPVPADPLENIAFEAPKNVPRDLFRAELAEAVGLGNLSPEARRIEILRSMSSPLSGSERDVLLAALMQPRPPGVSAGWFSEYFHRMAVLMQRQEGDRKPFARALATVARDSSRDGVVRDYAIQHLRQVWDRADLSGGLRPSIEATFRELCASNSDVSPAALLSLHLLGTPAGGERPEESPLPARRYAVDDSELEPLVLSVLREPPSASTVKARMTASRVAGDRGLFAASNQLLEIARDRSEHALVRMAAVSALGRIGNAPDISALASIEPGDRRVAHAIQCALNSRPLPER